MISSFKRCCGAVLVLLLWAAGTIAAEPPAVTGPLKNVDLPGEAFLVEGRAAFVLLPPESLRQTPQPWILYGPTLPAYPDRHERWMHQQFLAAGVAVAGVDAGEAYGSPRGQRLMSALYRELTQNRGFAAKPCLLGRSRGGLWASSWAIAHPERVAGIAGIYPVFDLRTYPGLDKAAPAYAMTPQELEADLATHNPIARIDVLAKAKLPICIIHGDQDTVVPLKENSAAVADRYRHWDAAEAMQLIVAPGQGHNFWEGFFRCQQLVDFAIARAKAGAPAAKASAPAAKASAPAAKASAPAAPDDVRSPSGKRSEQPASTTAEARQSLRQHAFAGQRSTWHGFDRYDFAVDGKPVLVVAPAEPAAGRPWLWHGEFFGHRTEVDIALLKRGFHIAYMRVPDMLGSPAAVAHWDAFYRELTETYGLAPKPALVALSRGGLYVYNWAAANPDRVACIYADAPVCDFKSWPGGKGRGPGSPQDWQRVLQQYRLADEAAALAYRGNPVDQLAGLADAGVPLLHVYGDADEVVPWEENTGLLAERYRHLGGAITLIVKPAGGHHPHGLDDPAPIVDFIARHTVAQRPQSAPPTHRDPIDALAAALQPTRQIVYKKVAGRELLLHVFDPPGRKTQSDQRPCFLIFHGGGWSGGEPRRMYPFAEHFARLGMVGISAQYRLLDPARGSTVQDCVKDARSAARFVRDHAASLGVDPDKLIISGGSAGGHLALATAILDGHDQQGESTAVSCVPNALVLLFPVIDTSPAGYGSAKIGDSWRELSPVHQLRSRQHQLSGRVPPTLIFHGTADTVTPLAGAEAFFQAMQRAGNRCELIKHEGGKHGYLMHDAQLYRDTLARSEAFLDSLGLLPAPQK